MSNARPDVVQRLERARSDARGLKQAAFHGGLIAATALCSWYLRLDGILGFVPDWLILALAAFTQSFLFMPLHEAVHQTAFASVTLNRLCALVTGLLSFRPPLHYFKYHMAHHAFTGDKRRDPELQNTFLDMQLSTWPAYVLYLTGLPFWIDRISTLLRHALFGVFLGREYYIQTERDRVRVKWEARAFVAVYALLFGGSFWWYPALFAVLLRVWLVPTVVGQPFLRWYLLAEHHGCQPIPKDMDVSTRTTSTHWFYAALAWQMPFHSEHHAYSSVPFHALPQLHAALTQRVRRKSGCDPDGSEGYWSVHWRIMRSLRWW